MFQSALAQFVPVLSSEAGLSLTTMQWQALGCDAAAYSLESLLCKPGYDVLASIFDLGRYLNCPGTLILNASTLKTNKEGFFKVHSPCDGKIISFSYEQLIALIQHLNPDIVLLPNRMGRDALSLLENWNENIIPYFSVDDLKENFSLMQYGLYVDVDHPQFLEQVNTRARYPLYVYGALDVLSMQKLKALNSAFIESDRPAQDGLDGVVYGTQGPIDLKEDKNSMYFKPIDAQCSCGTCAAQLTQAYLHHLYEHTPLLAQRFLIQHNVFAAINS